MSKIPSGIDREALMGSKMGLHEWNCVPEAVSRLKSFTNDTSRMIFISLKKKRNVVDESTNDKETKDKIDRCINAVNQCIEQLDAIKRILNERGLI